MGTRTNLSAAAVASPYAAPGWRANEETRATLVCLPYAGGPASAYLPHAALMPPDIALCPLQLPGRQNRVAEPAQVDIPAIAQAIEDLVVGPYAVYGHSAGALIAFEAVRQLRAQGAARPPVALIVSSATPPDEEDRRSPALVALDDASLLEELVKLGGLSAEVKEDRRLVALIAQVVRADMAWLAARRHQQQEPLATPIAALVGDTDPIVEQAAMRRWARQTSDRFRFEVIPGGHFAPFERPETLTNLAAELLRDAAGG